MAMNRPQARNDNYTSLIPGGYGNPTGVNTGGLTSGALGDDTTSSQPFTPSGAPGLTTVGTTPTVSHPTARPAVSGGGDTPTTSPIPGVGTGGATSNSNNPLSIDIASLLGLAGNNTNILKNLNSIFGGGIGDTLYSFLKSGAGYNPAVVKALQDAMIPSEQRGRANVMESFGRMGAGESSAAAIGVGDFESNFALGQDQILANEYNNSVDRYQSLFSNVLNSAYNWKQNQLNPLGILSGLLGGLGQSGLLKSLMDLLGKLGKGGGGASGGAGGGSTGQGGGGGGTNKKPKPTGGGAGSGGGLYIPGGDPSLNLDPDILQQIASGDLMNINQPGNPLNDLFNQIFGGGDSIPTLGQGGGPQTTPSDPSIFDLGTSEHTITDVNGQPISDLYNDSGFDFFGGGSTDYGQDTSYPYGVPMGAFGGSGYSSAYTSYPGGIPTDAVGNMWGDPSLMWDNGGIFDPGLGDMFGGDWSGDFNIMG